MWYITAERTYLREKTVGMLWELSYRKIRFFLNFFVLPPSKYLSQNLSPLWEMKLWKSKGMKLRRNRWWLCCCCCATLKREGKKLTKLSSFNSSLKYLQSSSERKKNHSLRRKMKERERERQYVPITREYK